MTSIAIRHLPEVGNIFTIARSELGAKIGQAIGASPRVTNQVVAAVNIQTTKSHPISNGLPQYYLGTHNVATMPSVRYYDLLERSLLTQPFADISICFAPAREIRPVSAQDLTFGLSQLINKRKNQIEVFSGTIKATELAQNFFGDTAAILELPTEVYDGLCAHAEPHLNFDTTLLHPYLNEVLTPEQWLFLLRNATFKD